MSPEQLEGKEVDARTDIFALGAVLYEMATGRRAFEGGSRAATLSAVLTSQPPPMLSVRPELPPALEALVVLCLAKSRDLRWQSAHDVNLQLEAIRTTAHPGVASGKPARRVGWAIAALAPAAFALVFLLGRPKPAPRAETVRFSMPPPAGRTFSWAVEVQTLAVSPDGSRIAFVSSPKAAVSPARSGGASPDTPRTPGVWVRDVAALDARPVPGTEDASSIFWAPDGKSLGFFTPGKLKRILLAEGASAVSICDLPPGGGKAGTWGADGTILFTSVQAPAVFRVPAAGGRPDQPIEAQASRGEIRLNWPWFLPDGKRFLYVARLRDGAGELMFAEPGKPPRVVAPMASIAQYVEPGYIVFAREGALLAQRFDPGLARLTGDPIPIADRVNYFLSTGLAFFAVSPSGTLVYHSQDDVSRLTWFDLAGRPLETIGPPGNYLNLAIGREGKRVFYDRTRSGIGTYDVWSWDLSRGVETPITNVTDSEFAPIELPDGKSIVYSANREGAPELFRRNLESGADERLTDAQRAFQQVQDLSPDGRTLVYVERSASGNFDIWTLALAGGKPTPFLQSSFDKQEVRFSPDGRFLAFISDESGRSEVYVVSFPEGRGKVQVSTNGGSAPKWTRGGKEIVYQAFDDRIMAVDVDTSGLPDRVAKATVPAARGGERLHWDLTADGERFLFSVPLIRSSSLCSTSS